MKREDFSVKVRRAADEASNNGKCWWVKKYILSSYLWRGPLRDIIKDKKFRESYETKENNLQTVDELC